MLTQYMILDFVKAVNKSYVPAVLGMMVEDDESKGDVAKEFEQRWSLKAVPEGAKDPSKIRQGLLFEKPGFYLRIREETPEGTDPAYTMTCKFFLKNDEAEVSITKEMFARLWNETEKDKRMVKTRWRMKDGEHLWEIDDIDSPEAKKGIVAEIETDKKDEKVEPPESFEVIKKFTY